MDPTQDHHRTAQAIEMGGVQHDEQMLDRILQLVTELTERTVRSACAASVTLPGDDGAFTPNASETIALDLDEAQYAAGDGPCLDALGERQVVNASLDADDGPWAEFTGAARANEIGSILSLPLMVRDRSLGALNVYSRDSCVFDDTEVTTATLLAQQAAAVLANAGAFADAAALNDQLREALATRDLIGQAKGILMVRERCDADAAFDVLRRASQRTNRKLREIATEVVESIRPERAERA